MHHVAVGDDVFLAFETQLAGIAGAGFAAYIAARHNMLAGIVVAEAVLIGGMLLGGS